MLHTLCVAEAWKHASGWSLERQLLHRYRIYWLLSTSEVPVPQNPFHCFRKNSMVVPGLLLMLWWRLCTPGSNVWYLAAGCTHDPLPLKPPPEAAKRILHKSIGYSQLAKDSPLPHGGVLSGKPACQLMGIQKNIWSLWLLVTAGGILLLNYLGNSLRRILVTESGHPGLFKALTSPTPPHVNSPSKGQALPICGTS